MSGLPTDDANRMLRRLSYWANRPFHLLRALGQTKARRRQQEIVAWNVKVLCSLLAREQALRNFGPDRPTPAAPGPSPILSRGCVQQDFHEDWFLYWCDTARFARAYHRKLWEHAYVLQTLHSLDLLREGKSGIGFGVGREPEPSIMAACGVSVLATDLDENEAIRKGWTETDQHAADLSRMYRADIVSREVFDARVRFRAVDMNAIPADLDGQFDFCWSSCALEHLGSIRNGLDFIKNSLGPLKPGGIAVHTTEFNYLHGEKTLDNAATVLFRRRDFELLVRELEVDGHEIYPFDFDVLRSPLDYLIDVPPYPHEGGAGAPDFHLRLAVNGFATTSFGVVVRKRA